MVTLKQIAFTLKLKPSASSNQEALLPTAGVQKNDACLMILLAGTVD